MPRISVIVPAQDVLEYVEFVIRDLRSQTWRDFEVLLVDDGSVDGTHERLTQAAENDARFHVLDSGGRGTSAARNHGLSASSGDQIVFVDADDRLSPQFLEKLHLSLEATGSDLASGNARRLDGFETAASGLHLRAFTDPVLATHLSESPQLVYDTTIWNKLIRRQLWEDDGLRFDEGRIINDVYPSLRSHVLARQVDLIGDTIYYWRIREDPSGSITDSKLTDPVARLRSLEDRLFGLERSRGMLASDLPDPEVLRRFDERVLMHDLWVYLPFYVDGDDDFRRTLALGVRSYLARYNVEPSSFLLGKVLTGAYEAIADQDDARAEELLHPSTRTVAVARGGRVDVEVDSGADDPGPLARFWRSAAVTRRRRSRDGALESEALIDRVDLLDRAGAVLTISGRVRVRDGRHPLEGPWHLAVELTGRKTGARYRGFPSGICQDPDMDLHPLQRSGWRRFVASVEVGSLPAAETTWRVRLFLTLGEADLALGHRLTAPATRYVGSGIPITSEADLVPIPKADDALMLRRERAPIRLLEVQLGPAGELQLEGDRPRASHRLWLQTPDGDIIARAGAADGQRWTLPLHDVGNPLPPRCELWCASADGSATRVRVAPTFTTTSLPSFTSPGQVLVIRPTIRGRAIVAIGPPRPLLTSVVVDEGDRAIVLGGPVLHDSFQGRSVLEARCRWTDQRLQVPVTHSDAGWRASLPAADLPGSSGGRSRGREWVLTLIGHLNTSVTLGIPSEGRDRFPLSASNGDVHTQVRIGPSSSARLWASPDPPEE